MPDSNLGVHGGLRFANPPYNYNTFGSHGSGRDDPGPDITGP
jgi:hypothetical protein